MYIISIKQYQAYETKIYTFKNFLNARKILQSKDASYPL